MANRDTFDIESPRSDVQFVTMVLQGAGAAALVPADPGGREYDIVSVARTGAGTFDIVMKHAYAQLLCVMAGSHGATPGLHARVEDVDVEAKTMTVVCETFGDGTAAAYQTGVVVAAHTATLGDAGAVVMVEATTADSTGVKQIQSTAAPAADFVRVTYSSGVPTLTFNATDNVTAATVLQIPGDASAQAVDPASDDFIYLTLVVRNSKLN